MEQFHKLSQALGRRLSRIKIYPIAHTETALVFYTIWLVFWLASISNILISYPPKDAAGWMLLVFLGLILLPADIFLPATQNPLVFRFGYLLLEALLVTLLASFDRFSVVSYVYFGLIGQAAFILPVYLAVVYLGMIAGLYFFFGQLFADGLVPGIPWLIGAVFTLTVMFLLRNARLQRDQIAELLAKLEAANELVQAQADALERQIKEDSLTGLANRRYLDNDLPREVERSRRFNKSLALAMVDIDHFKQVNDQFSHQVGDHVLVVVADIFRQNSRHAIDSLVRYGGEEFVLYFPETSLDESLVVCERIRLAIQDFDWSQISAGLKVTVSIGVASLQGKQHYTELLDTADTQLYQAKASGRNRIYP